jgi:hypothetical protein
VSYVLIERAYPDKVKIGDKISKKLTFIDGNSNQLSLKAGANDIYNLFIKSVGFDYIISVL